MEKSLEELGSNISPKEYIKQYLDTDYFNDDIYLGFKMAWKARQPYIDYLEEQNKELVNHCDSLEKEIQKLYIKTFKGSLKSG